jgi:HD-GYP domain-containing protein (c-di-GMP phosphodiesterase class II)
LLEQAAILHDIGKIGIDKSILHNPGRLTDEEFATMQQHPVIATHILKNIDHLADVQECVVKHHERFDGNGYPYGISGDDLPVEARIMAIADTFDAMTSNRPYRKGLAVDVAVQELSNNAGTQFDPELVSVFIALLREGELNNISEGLHV